MSMDNMRAVEEIMYSNTETVLKATGYFGLISVGLGALVLFVSKNVKNHVKVLMGSHLFNTAILLLSFVLITSRSTRISCYLISLLLFLGSVLTYMSTVILSVFNFAAVFYPHVFYRREMLGPAGLAILGSWIVGISVSVPAVGSEFPAGRACTPVPLMSRYGVATLTSTCLLCTIIVVAINMKLVHYFRKSRI